MEIVLRDNEDELCIDFQDGSIGFTVLTTNRPTDLAEKKQLDFSIDLDQWRHLKTFIDDSIYECEQAKK